MLILLFRKQMLNHEKCAFHHSVVLISETMYTALRWEDNRGKYFPEQICRHAHLMRKCARRPSERTTEGNAFPGSYVNPANKYVKNVLFTKGACPFHDKNARILPPIVTLFSPPPHGHLPRKTWYLSSLGWKWSGEKTWLPESRRELLYLRKSRFWPIFTELLQAVF